MKDELDFKKRQVGSSSFFFVFFLSWEMVYGWNSSI
jgi:hypothetical protein